MSEFAETPVPVFLPGFTSRQDGAAAALARAFGGAPVAGFAPFDIRPAKPEPAEPTGPVHFSPQAPGPKHFSPADPDANPTEGWDPFAAAEEAPVAGPFVDTLAVAREEGFADGHAAGLAEATARAEGDRALLDRLVAALGSEGRLDREDLARRLRQTVLFLVAKLVGETGVAGDLLAGRIEAATDLLADHAESAMLRVNPDDVAVLDGKLPATIFAVGDATVARGSFVLESSSAIVEDGPERWLEQLAQAIDRLPLPLSKA